MKFMLLFTIVTAAGVLVCISLLGAKFSPTLVAGCAIGGLIGTPILMKISSLVSR